jgi:hypothetical protein
MLARPVIDLSDEANYTLCVMAMVVMVPHLEAKPPPGPPLAGLFVFHAPSRSIQRSIR